MLCVFKFQSVLFIQQIVIKGYPCASHYAGSWGIASSKTSTVPAFKEYTFEGGDFKNNYKTNYLLSFAVNATEKKTRVSWIIESGHDLFWMSEKVSLRM